MPRFEIVLSTENRPYQVWQAMLFHYSCLTHQGCAPRIVVHKGDEPLLEGFELIEARDGVIQPAPNYRHHRPVTYPVRNTPATLLHVETDADYVMLCEPDMIFLQALPPETLAIGPREITFDPVTYLEPDRPAYQPAVDEVCRRAGLDPQVLRTRPINGGVPHVIPRPLVRDVGQLWLEGIEHFVQHALECAGGDLELAADKIDWIASMWCPVMAVHRLDLTPVMTRLCLSNLHGTAPLPRVEPQRPKIVHFCYGGDDFTKRAFTDLKGAMHDVWRVAPDDGTINGAIRGQLHAAREFYRL